MTLKSDAKFEENLLLVPKGSFCPKHIQFQMKSTEELCLMIMESDAKFEGKQTLGSKNDLKNLVNFNGSSGKSEDFHSDVLLFSKVYYV